MEEMGKRNGVRRKGMKSQSLNRVLRNEVINERGVK